MPRPHAAYYASVGTVIVHDGETVTKRHPSAHHPFPWLSEHGTELGDEWASRAIADGAHVIFQEKES